MLALALPKPQPAEDRYRSPKPLTGTLGKAQGLQPDKRGPQMCRAAQDRASLEPLSWFLLFFVLAGEGVMWICSLCVCVTVHPDSHLAEAPWLGVSSLSPAR